MEDWRMNRIAKPTRRVTATLIPAGGSLLTAEGFLRADAGRGMIASKKLNSCRNLVTDRTWCISNFVARRVDACESLLQLVGMAFYVSGRLVRMS